MRNQSIQLLLIACCVVLGSPELFAQDWPQWRGPSRDNVVRGFTAPKTWPSELTPKWKTEVGLGDSSPVLAGDRVFVFTRVGDEEIMNCLDAATGQIVWQEKQPSIPVTGGAAQHPGPRSTPAVTDDKIVGLGVGGRLSCWNAKTGEVLWRKDSAEFPKPHPTFYTSVSPIIVDGLCVIHLGAEGNGALVAYDLATGNEKWRLDGEGPSYGSPNVISIDGMKQVVTQTEKSLMGVDLADGKLLWKTPIQGRGAINGTPIPLGNGVIYTTGTTTLARIVRQGDEFTLEQVWNATSPSPKFSVPLLKDGFVYCATAAGNLFCIDAASGEVTWTDTTRREDPLAVIDAGNVLLVLSKNSELAVIEPNGKEFRELAKVKVAETPVWSYPIVSGNRLFVKDKTSLAMFVLE